MQGYNLFSPNAVVNSSIQKEDRKLKKTHIGNLDEKHTFITCYNLSVLFSKLQPK